MTYGIDDVGVNIQISFVTEKEPTKENIEKIEKLLESSKAEKSLSSYYINVKFVRAEVIIEDKEDKDESNDKPADESVEVKKKSKKKETK